MCDRNGTVMCTFYKESPKISAFDTHEWVNKHRRKDENEVTTIQIDGPKRKVFIILHRHVHQRPQKKYSDIHVKLWKMWDIYGQSLPRQLGQEDRPTSQLTAQNVC